MDAPHSTGLFLWINMSISSCCKAKLYSFSANEGVMQYMCYACDMACNIIPVLENQKDNTDDTRSSVEAETIVGEP